MSSVALFSWSTTELGMILELNTRGVAIFKQLQSARAAEPFADKRGRHSVAAADLEHSAGSMARESTAQANRSEILVAMLGHYP